MAHFAPDEVCTVLRLRGLSSGIAMGTIQCLFLRNVLVLRSESWEMMMRLFLTIVVASRVTALLTSHNALAGFCVSVFVDFKEDRSAYCIDIGMA